MAHALVHILGSRSGYTTLDASGGVTASERSELEVLTFGGATSGDALGRLESSASMIGRKLQSGRFAVSRMFPGGIDDEGRPTIEVVSVLLDRAGYEAVVGALPRLANELRIWRGCRESVAVGYELPEQSCAFRPNDPGVIRAFDAWNAARERDGIALLTSADSVSLLAMVALLDPTDLIECRWGIGVLSLSAPVDLCILATSTSRVGPRLVIAPASAGIMLSTKMDSALWLIRQNSDESQLPAVNKLRAASAEPIDEPEHDGWHPPIAEPRAPSTAKRKNLTPIAAMSAAASMLLLVGMIVLYVRVGKMRAPVNSDGGLGAKPAEAPSPETKSTPPPNAATLPATAPLGATPTKEEKRAASDDAGVSTIEKRPADSEVPVATIAPSTKPSEDAPKAPDQDPPSPSRLTVPPSTQGTSVAIDPGRPKLDANYAPSYDDLVKIRENIAKLSFDKLLEKIPQPSNTDPISAEQLKAWDDERRSLLEVLRTHVEKAVELDLKLKNDGEKSGGDNFHEDVFKEQMQNVGFCKTINHNIFTESKNAHKFVTLEKQQVPELCEAWEEVLKATKNQLEVAKNVQKRLEWLFIDEKTQYRCKVPTETERRDNKDAAWRIVHDDEKYSELGYLEPELAALKTYLAKALAPERDRK